jgi:hypothetical protein
MTICHTSVAPKTMPINVHTSNKTKVPRKTSREPATLVTPSKTLKDFVFRKILWTREGGVGICGGEGSLYCWSEDEEDEDMIGVISPLQGEDSGRSCDGAEISIVEWRGGLHLALFRCRHLFPNFSISHPRIAMQS